MKNIKFILIVLILIGTGCKDRPRSNPFDPDTGLDTSQWAPSNLQAEVINDSQIRLTWEQEENRIDGFRILRKAGSSNYFQIAEITSDSTHYTDTGLSLGVTYTYRVKAFTETNESGFVTSTPMTTSFPPPTNLTAAAIDDQSIHLTWTHNCDFEDGYRIERSEGGSFTQIAELDVDVSSYTDTGLSLGVTYTYRVKAFTETNESNFTETSYYFWQDCSGVWNGESVEDCTGQCGGTAVIDCTGVCDGTAYVDDCGICSGGNTGHIANGDQDCNGMCFGTAFINICEYCVGGNTGINEGHCDPVTDIDGNEYETVAIGTQLWMAENLKVTHYRNGDPIPTGFNSSESGSSEWGDLSIGAYAVYNAELYGNLYNWYAIDDARDICPEGWHVPSDEEWMELEMALGMSYEEAHTQGWRGTNEGSKLAGNADLWNNGDLEDNSEFGTSGFNALPGGNRGYYYGQYYGMGSDGFYWSSTETNSFRASYRRLYDHSSYVFWDDSSLKYGLSVRCVMD